MTVNPSLAINFAGVSMKNPVVLAAGPHSENGLLLKKAALAGAGAVTTRVIYLEKGTPLEWTTIGPNTVINHGGVSPLGFHAWVSKELAIAKQGGAPVIATLENPKNDPQEVVTMTQGFADAGADLIIINYPGSLEATKSSIHAAKKTVDIPVLLKVGIGDWSTYKPANIHKVGEVAEKAGADGLVAIDAIASVCKIDTNTMQALPLALNDRGWSMGGAAIHPLAVFCVTKLARATTLPIIGLGGVHSTETAIEMLLAGATAVGLCSAVAIHGLPLLSKIIQGIEQYLHDHDLSAITDLTGKALP